MGQAMVTYSGVLEGSGVSSNPPGSGDPSFPGSSYVVDLADQEVLDVVIPVVESEVGNPNQVFVILPNGELATHQEASLPFAPASSFCDVVDAGDFDKSFGPPPVGASPCGLPPLGAMISGAPAPPSVALLEEEEAGGGAPSITPDLEVAQGDVLVGAQLGLDSDLDSSRSFPMEDRLPFGDGVCPGFPTMGIMMRSKSRACDGPPPGRGGGGTSGGKKKKKKKIHKYDHAMAVALEALFKSPDYNA